MDPKFIFCGFRDVQLPLRFRIWNGSIEVVVSIVSDTPWRCCPCSGKCFARIIVRDHSFFFIEGRRFRLFFRAGVSAGCSPPKLRKGFSIRTIAGAGQPDAVDARPVLVVAVIQRNRRVSSSQRHCAAVNPDIRIRFVVMSAKNRVQHRLIDLDLCLPACRLNFGSLMIQGMHPDVILACGCNCDSRGRGTTSCRLLRMSFQRIR